MRSSQALAALGSAIAILLPVGTGDLREPLPEPSVTATTEDGGFGLGATSGEDSVREPNPGATPPDEDPADPGPATIENIALEYETVGLDPCLFDGLRRDDEADLAIGDIDRTCPRPEETEDDVAAEDEGPTFEEIVAYISTQYVTLPIDASPIRYQPDGDWALINMDFIVHTDPSPQTFDVNLLGMDVTFRATPVHWTWDFGDGTPPLPTSSPGTPYPNHDVAHVYSAAHEGVTVSAITSWQGSFQINGSGPWFPVATHASTTATTAPIEIVAMEVNLVPGANES